MKSWLFAFALLAALLPPHPAQAADVMPAPAVTFDLPADEDSGFRLGAGIGVEAGQENLASPGITAGLSPYEEYDSEAWLVVRAQLLPQGGYDPNAPFTTRLQQGGITGEAGIGAEGDAMLQLKMHF